MARFVSEVDLDAQPDADALTFCFAGGRLLVRPHAELAVIPAYGELAQDLVAAEASIYLGRLGERPCFALALGVDQAAPPGYEMSGLRELFGRLEEEVQAVAGRAFQTVEWYLNHAFCGRCGTPTELVAAERARGCKGCGAAYFPRINPAVIMLVERDGQMLLARNRAFRGPFYSALAGFVEPGESLEEAVAREVEEEVGLEIERIEYFGSQPWPFPSQLMIGFTAHHRAGDIRLQDGELMEARWFSAGELPSMPGRFSLARRLIDAFVARHRPGTVPAPAPRLR